MLIQVTNKCHEGCAHCLQDSLPNGYEMSDETFKNALKFGHFLGLSDYMISGGEPTEHSDLKHLLKLFEILFYNFSFTSAHFFICSNGTWVSDPNKLVMMFDITKLKHYAGCQIYSNKKWYKDYDEVKESKDFYNKMDKVMFDEEPIFMQDLGRARNNPQAQEEVKKNLYHCSCLNASLTAHQLKFPRDVGKYMNIYHSLACHPLVDWRGNVHMSESWLCPSVGNVNKDNFMDIWHSMQSFKPCMKCALAKKMLTEESPKIKAACTLLGLK